jgi:hypothetical protein
VSRWGRPVAILALSAIAVVFAITAPHSVSRSGTVDVITGDNHVRYLQGEITHAAKGWKAVPGYDLASGLGTIDAAKLVPELARLARES